MAPRAKVPFALHPAVRLRSNTEIDRGCEAVLSPDGATAAVIRGEWAQRRLELHTLATGAVTVALSPEPGQSIEHAVWSRDGRRWAVAQLRFEGDRRTGVVFVGEPGRDAPLCIARTSDYGGVTLNDLARPSPLLAFSPDGERVVLRVCGHDDRSALMHISVATGAVQERWLDPSELDLYAHAFTDDGTLFTASAFAGDGAGLAWYPPDADRPAGRSPWPHGFVVLPARRGLWVLGARHYCFRVAPGPAVPVAPAAPPRLDRLRTLRARASTRWDQAHLDQLIDRAVAGSESGTYFASRNEVSTGHEPPSMAGLRCLEHELSWETSFAARLGDDDVVVSDGVGVWRWRDDGAALTRDLLLDDTQRSTHRTARVLGLSLSGDTLALLWKKDARGEATVLSCFEIDRAALDAAR